MSSMYYKVMPKSKAVKMYGYQKVNPDQIAEINSRLCKPTNASMYGLVEYKGDGQYKKRPHTACLCHRAPEDAVLPVNNKVYVDERTLNRIIRRLRTPTFCSQIGKADKDTDDMDTDLNKLMHRRPRTDAEEKKRIRRITRPTTATSQKKIGCCYICDDKYKSPIMEQCFCADKTVPEEELEEILWRVQNPTNASQGGKDMCRRAPEATKITIEYDRLPLVSGLARTRKVDDIVKRLYQPRNISSANDNKSYYSAYSSDVVLRPRSSNSYRRARSAQPRVC